MNDELPMDLADCLSPEKLIAAILKHHPNWNAPVPVEELAAAVNIVKIEELNLTASRARSKRTRKIKGRILYKAGTRAERRRFTVAHEPGYFPGPSHKGNQQCMAADLRENCRDTVHRQRQEAEANQSPARLFNAEALVLQGYGVLLGDADATDVQTLAKTLQDEPRGDGQQVRRNYR